jgi:3-methyladenine DNA glycosylase/8-oxoguanine DNA glycosylase
MPTSKRAFQFSASLEDAVKLLAKQDPRMAWLIDTVGPCRLEPRSDRSLFESLVRSIIFQQLNGIAAETILTRFKLLFPQEKFPPPEQVQAMTLEMLRTAGISRSKGIALHDLAEKVLTNQLPTDAEIPPLTDEELTERLTIVRGIGPWSVQMFLIFSLGRLDVLPVTDYGVQKGFMLVYGKRTLPTATQLTRAGAKWRPYRSVASWYLWRALELPEFK